MKTTLLRDAVRTALIAGASMAAAAPAFAQDAPATPATTELDRIEVTGSRIRQVDTETAAPVLLIDRAGIEKQGFKSVADILQNIPTAGSPAISRTSPLSSGEAVGGYYIDLRNLGANRTLILVNGKRLGITNDGLQDVASIPSAMVERIEVLKDGASTIYGSDAIAGVVNIITRKNFEGAEANAYLGQWGEGDGQRQVYDFVTGATSDKGSVTFGVEYTKEDPVFARNRWFSRDRFPTGDKSAPRPGGASAINQYGTITNGPRGSQIGVDDDGAPIYNTSYTINRPEIDPSNFNNFHETGLDPRFSDTSNPNEQSTVYSGIERKSIFANVHYDISDKIAFDSDVLYTDRDSFAQNAGYPYQSAAFGTPVSVDSIYNPLGTVNAPLAGQTPQEVEFFRRGWDVPRGVQNNLQTFRFTGAFSGAFQIGEKFWDWDVGYLYNNNKGVQKSTGNLNTVAVANAVGPSFINAQGVAQCGTAANAIPLGFGPGACTPWNPFAPAGSSAPGALADPNVQAYLYLPGQALSETTTKNYFANLTGSLFTLPAGEVGLAVGVEHRSESGSFSPDALAQTGISTDLASGPTAGGYSLDEVYAELQVPILADLPGAQELSVSLASRYSDYDTFGDTVNSKFGFKWKPIESLLVRGTWSEGFRAPTVADLFGGQSQTFENYTDPCDTLFGAGAGNARCAAVVPANFRQKAQGGALASGPGQQTPVPFVTGSNPGLTPETSVSKTLGLVWSPGFAEGLNMSLDWWNIRIENTIVADSPTAQLEDCYLRNIDSRCSTFTRDPATGDITSLSFGGRNAGYVETEGYDFDINYRITTDYGNFTASLLNSYISKNEIKADNSENPASQNNGFGGYFRLRSNASLSWQQGDWGATWSTRYYSGVKESCYFADRCTDPNFTAPELQGNFVDLNKIGSNTFHDVQVSYNTPWNATVAIGANNVFEHYAAPQYDQPNSGFSYYGGYDIGRFMYLKYQQRF